MTMKTNKFLAIAAVAVAMTACSNDENGKSTPKYIQISAGIPTPTRTVVTADGNLNFASGDAISVYVWTGSASALPTNVSDYVVNGSTNTYDGTKWTASPNSETMCTSFITWESGIPSRFLLLPVWAWASFLTR